MPTCVHAHAHAYAWHHLEASRDRRAGLANARRVCEGGRDDIIHSAPGSFHQSCPPVLRDRCGLSLLATHPATRLLTRPGLTNPGLTNPGLARGGGHGSDAQEALRGACICMCICMCIYACTYACAYVHVHMHVHMHVHACTCECMRMRVWVHACVRVHACVCACMCARMHVCTGGGFQPAGRQASITWGPGLVGMRVTWAQGW